MRELLSLLVGSSPASTGKSLAKARLQIITTELEVTEHALSEAM